MWLLNTIRIFVQDIQDSDGQLIASLNPLDSGTIYQVFGYEDLTSKVSAYIVGDVDKAALIAYSKTGLTYVLSGPEGALGSYYVSKVGFKRLMGTCQTIRQDLDTDAPVYMVDLELLKDE